MTFALYSTLEQTPPGFEYKPALTKRDIRRGSFAIFIDDQTPLIEAFGHLFSRVAGLIITPAPIFSITTLEPLVWHLTIPPVLTPTIEMIAQSYLTLLVDLRTERNQNKRQAIELSRTQTDLERLTNYAELIQAQLRSDLQRYTEWMVRALTDLLKFEALEAKQVSIAEFPTRIANFLLSSTFSYTGVAIFSKAKEHDWICLVQVGEWGNELKIPSRFDADIWQEETELYTPFIVHDEQHLVIVSKGGLRPTYGDYEFTFFRLLAPLLSATYQAKLLENALQMELEERIHAEEALARALRTKDEFLASMSHELRTPLNAVLGQAELMLEGVHGTLPEKHVRALHIISESGHHLLSLIEDILDLAKIEAMATELEMVTVKIGAVCQSSLRMVKESAQSRQIKIIYALDYELDEIEADERRLKQILINLLSNAIKFTPEGGRVGLEVLGNEAEGLVHFTVWDTGIGIAPENVDKLFEPFVQLDSGLSRKYEGTGLGLALVKRLAEMHKGKVLVESELGKGSRFTVALPLRDVKESRKSTTVVDMMEVTGGLVCDAAEKRPLSPAPSISTRPRILIAEDNPTNVMTLLDILAYLDYETAVATNGQEAILSAQANPPDLILMDIQMPVLDGLEATKRLRANQETADIPIIAVTGLAMTGDRERCLQAGCNDYLNKPVHLRELQKKIQTLL